MNAMDKMDGRILLPIARAAIARELGAHQSCAEDAEWLRDPGACFVTLKLDGRLRGCIGSLHARRPLLDDVKANALAAAFKDPRFRPLGLAELDRTAVEISLLSALEPLVCRDEAEALAQLQPGRDGVLFSYGYHQSTFLPQVWDEIADPIEFLASLRQKAGLPPDFWDPDVKLARYTVSKFSELNNPDR